MKVKKSIAKALFYWLIPIIFCFALIMVGFWIITQQKLYDDLSASIKKRHIDQNKLMVKREVQSVVRYIEQVRVGVRTRLENNIKERTYEAYNVAMNLYQTYHGKLSDADIKDMIKQSLRAIRYNNGRGYYFATNFNGTEELFTDHPEMEGKDLLELQNIKGQFVIIDMIHIAKQLGEGFYEYAWSKPNAEGYNFRKIAFIKRFEPYDWFIGTGEYIDDVEQDVKEEVLIWLNKLWFGEDCYIGAFTFDGVRIAFPVKEELGVNVWNFTDANGVKVVQEGIKWAKTQDGGFVEAVSSIKPATGKSGRKISYFMGIPEWQWAISTGVYLDEVDEYIENKKAELHETIARGSLYTVAMFSLLTFFLVFAIAYISRKTDAGFQSFISFFDRAARGSTLIDATTLSFSEFDKLAASANCMIEERHHALEALQRSEEKLQAILDFSPVAIALTALNGRIEYINRKHMEWFGYSLEEIPTVAEWLAKARPSEANCQSILSAWASVLSAVHETGKEIASREVAITCRDGSVREVAILVAVVSNRVLVIFNDITDRKKAETELRESEEKYRRLVETTGTGYVIIDDKGVVTDANQEYAHLTGRKGLRDVIGHSVLEWTAPHDLERNAMEVRKCVERGFVRNLELVYVTPSGRAIPVEINATVLRVSGAFRILSLCRDITERKRVEEEIAEKERKYRLLFETANDGIILLDETGVMDCNQRCADLYGLAREEVIGRHPADLSPERQSDGRLSSEVVTEKILAALKGDPQSFHWQIARPDGLVMETEIALNRVEMGGSVLLQAMVRDISERRRLEERLQRAEKMEALGTLAGGVAHDLNNVLGIVVGYSEMLLFELEESSSQKSQAMGILKGGQRAAAIVEDLLTLARRGVPSRRTLNLNKILLDCQKSPEFEKLCSFHPKVTIKTDFERDLLNIAGSSVHLEKSFFNLVSNAIEAMSDGGVITIKTRNQYLDKPVSGYDEVKEGDYVVLSVSDEGEGISPTDLKHIFEPFYTKKVMGRSGTGLGLAVVWGAVKDHNGYINVESELGIGTAFTLYFPITRGDITLDKLSISVSEYMGKGESILVVDDVKEQRDLAVAMLTKMNYNATSLSSGEEAVEYLKQREVDLVVLDMIMDPGIDGLDAYVKILQIHPHQRAIIVSGFSETERVSKAQALGAGAYVKKPYVLETLGLAVRKELERGPFPQRPAS